MTCKDLPIRTISPLSSYSLNTSKTWVCLRWRTLEVRAQQTTLTELSHLSYFSVLARPQRTVWLYVVCTKLPESMWLRNSFLYGAWFLSVIHQTAPWHQANLETTGARQGGGSGGGEPAILPPYLGAWWLHSTHAVWCITINLGEADSVGLVPYSILASVTLNIFSGSSNSGPSWTRQGWNVTWAAVRIHTAWDCIINTNSFLIVLEVQRINIKMLAYSQGFLLRRNMVTGRRARGER